MEANNFSDFERVLECPCGNPTARIVFNELIEEKVLEFKYKILGVNFYSLNKVQLQKLIDKQELFLLYDKYVEDNAIIFK